MKFKIFTVLVVLITSLSISKAQSYKNGDISVYGGLGLGYTYSIPSYVSSWPTILVGGDMGVYEINDVGVISAGAIMALKHMSFPDNGSGSDFYLGGRGTLHLTSLKIDKVDVYGGLSLGLRVYSDITNDAVNGYANNYNSGVFFGLFAGGKYYFTDNISVFGELGWDVAWLKLGVSYKIK